MSAVFDGEIPCGIALGVALDDADLGKILRLIEQCNEWRLRALAAEARLVEAGPDWSAGYEKGYRDGENSVEADLLHLFEEAETEEAAVARVKAWVKRLAE